MHRCALLTCSPRARTAQVTYDSAFAAALGRIGSISSTFNYDAAGNVLQQPSGSTRAYRYYQTQPYISDSWKLTPHLTLNYGLNYQYFTVPYETHGLETVQSTGFDAYFNARLAQSAAGISGPDTCLLSPMFWVGQRITGHPCISRTRTTSLLTWRLPTIQASTLPLFSTAASAWCMTVRSSTRCNTSSRSTLTFSSRTKQ